MDECVNNVDPISAAFDLGLQLLLRRPSENLRINTNLLDEEGRN